jgi:putative restriction endonuclease
MSDKFWKLVPKCGFESINQMGSFIRSFSNLNAAVDFAVLDEDMFFLMKEKKSNSILQQFLLDKYFPETKNNFSNSTMGQQKLFDDIEVKILREDATEYRREIVNLMQQQNEEEIFLRGSLFKREIPKIYNNTCCISGMKIDATTSVSMIDACHIIPFKESFDDTITNGIALCPNLHRAFDRGLITIDNNYKVLVSRTFKEDETMYSIRAFENQQILLPKLEIHFPIIDNLNWHRRIKFKV